MQESASMPLSSGQSQLSIMSLVGLKLDNPLLPLKIF